MLGEKKPIASMSMEMAMVMMMVQMTMVLMVRAAMRLAMVPMAMVMKVNAYIVHLSPSPAFGAWTEGGGRRRRGNDGRWKRWISLDRQ